MLISWLILPYFMAALACKMSANLNLFYFNQSFCLFLWGNQYIFHHNWLG